MSKVIVYENVLVEKPCQENKFTSKYELKEDYTGTFLNYGTDYQELENGVGQYSTFIIKKENGDVENVPVQLCKLIGDL